MRDHYQDAAIDIGSSGVLDYSLKEVRERCGITTADLDQVVFRDSPCLGREDLREAIASRWGTGDPRRVMTTHGGSEAIYTALSVLLEPGDQVIALAPAYHSHVSVAESIGCDVLRWRLREEDGFRPRLEDLEALVTARTKAIVVNFPHNPTGTTLSEKQLHRLLDITASAGAYLIWDAAFSDLVYAGDPLPDPGRFYPRTVSVGTFSKSMGLPGLRFGWCIAEPEVLSAMTVLRDCVTLSLSPLTELIALCVVENADSFIQPRLTAAAANRKLLIEWARQHGDVVDLPVPMGGVTAFPALGVNEDTRAICRRLGEAHRVLLIPGMAFDHPRRVRLGFGGDAEALREGLKVLARELAG
ncbi:capreomycidine synthase [Catenulispora pinisilvae]|uniref:capreomycidine synthase n=1 Tax=Catenulispora pinisilvae TaxID=2705253 RepID=UPI0018919375|nr:capreomycidine synthase [Catenulispora pinisilvae]